MSRRRFDVRRRLIQIALIQTILYMAVGIVLIPLSWIWGIPLTFSLLLSSTAIDLSSSPGYTPTIAFIIASLPVTAAIYLISDRAKDCLDFSSTAYFLHLLAVSIYDKQFPTGLSWWTIILMCAAGVAVTSEVLYIRREISGNRTEKNLVEQLPLV